MKNPFAFYCQLDYADVPYPQGGTGRGTIADNGCGPCCAAMVAENMLGIRFSPQDACRLAIECGAREEPGTNLYIFSPAFAEKVGLNVTCTEDADEALRFLQEGRGLAIANTQGDRPEDGWIGVFSDTGHYIVLAGAEGNTVRVWDPMYRPGRYDIPGRAGKVAMDGNEASADFEIIRQDCKDRPFFLFVKKEDFPLDQDDLVRIRRQLHMYPEMKWDLPMTSALVREELDKIGIPYEADVYGKHSVVATVNAEKEGFTIGLRADMDALPIQENNLDKPYRSRHEGIMHACGHDAHTAMMLGAARALWAIRDRLHCRVKLIFQPCEEGRPSGARTMCEHGVMKDIDCIVMCHVNCEDATHVISTRAGCTNCSSVAFKIALSGKAVHAATPHAGIDALAAGVKIYQGIQMLVSREVDPFDTCVMSVCTMHAGTTVSANADSCVLEGTIRCARDRTMAWARKRLETLARAVAEESGTGFELSWSGDPLPCAVNDENLYRAFRASAIRTVGKERVKELAISPGAEDFAYYEQERPGLLFGLGMRNEALGACHPAHTKDWDIDEAGLSTGVRVFVRFVLDAMDGIPGIS